MNTVYLCGILASDFSLNHFCMGVPYYKANLKVHRVSGVADLIPVMMPGTMYPLEYKQGDKLDITGEFRSYNEKISDTRIALRLFCFVMSCKPYTGDLYTPINELALEGVICKIASPRVSPLGKKLRDVLLAVPRSCDKCDYIPLVLFGSNTRKALGVGDTVKLAGRIQSRTFKKDGETHYAYEVAVSSLSYSE